MPDKIFNMNVLEILITSEEFKTSYPDWIVAINQLWLGTKGK